MMIRDARTPRTRQPEDRGGAGRRAQRAESAQKKSEATVLQKRNMLRGKWPRWRPRQVIENEAAIAARRQVTAEQELQRLRAELEKLRLECDVSCREAARLAQEARARGSRAVRGDGKAAALPCSPWPPSGRRGQERPRGLPAPAAPPFVEAAVARWPRPRWTS